MKGLFPLIGGLFATFAFSWIGLALVPNFQIGHLEPQMEEDGTDVYPMPQSGMVERGRRVYTENGCYYCHSLQTRPDYLSSDVDRTRDFDKDQKWATRRSAPRDYIFDRPVLLGKERMGPDLSNIGKAAAAEDQNAAPGASPAASPGASASPSPSGSPAARPSAAPSAPAAVASSTSAPQANAPTPATPTAPGPSQNAPPSSPTAGSTLATNAQPGKPKPYSAAWHHQHLYSPRSISPESIMPAFRFLYDERRITGEPSVDAVSLVGSEAPREGWEIVPSYDAKCLVAFLMSRDQSHALKEVKGVSGPATAPAASPAAAKPAPK